MAWRLVFATAVGDQFVSEHEADITTMSGFIGKAGVLEATIPVTNEEIGQQIQGILTGAGKLAVYAYHGNTIWWGGFLDTTSVSATEEGTVLDISGISFDSYPDDRDMWVDGKFKNLEQTEYVRHFWNYIQSQKGGNIGVETDFPAVVTRNRDMQWLASDAKKVGELMGEVTGNIDGFEWFIDVFDDGGRRRRVLTVGHPQVRRPSRPLLLNFPGNLVTYKIEADASQGATAFRARGMREDEAKDMKDKPEEWGKWSPVNRTIPSWIDQHTWQEWADLLEADDKKNPPILSDVHYATELLEQGYVRRDMTIDRPDEWTKDNLNAWARKGVEMRGGSLIVPQVLTFLDGFSRDMLGSFARIQITDTAYPAKDGGAPGYEGMARCIGYEITPTQFGRPDLVKLVFEDPFSRSMQTQARHFKSFADTVADSLKSQPYDYGSGGGSSTPAIPWNPGSGTGSGNNPGWDWGSEGRDPGSSAYGADALEFSEGQLLPRTGGVSPQCQNEGNLVFGTTRAGFRDGVTYRMDEKMWQPLGYDVGSVDVWSGYLQGGSLMNWNQVKTNPINRSLIASILLKSPVAVTPGLVWDFNKMAFESYYCTSFSVTPSSAPFTVGGWLYLPLILKAGYYCDSIYANPNPIVKTAVHFIKAKVESYTSIGDFHPVLNSSVSGNATTVWGSRSGTQIALMVSDGQSYKIYSAEFDGLTGDMGPDDWYALPAGSGALYSPPTFAKSTSGEGVSAFCEWGELELGATIKPREATTEWMPLGIGYLARAAAYGRLVTLSYGSGRPVGAAILSGAGGYWDAYAGFDDRNSIGGVLCSYGGYVYGFPGDGATYTPVSGKFTPLTPPA